MSELPGAASGQISLTQKKTNNLLSTRVHLGFLFPAAKANPNSKAPECQLWAGMEGGEEGRELWGAASWGGSSASAGAWQSLGRRQRGPQVCVCPAHTCLCPAGQDTETTGVCSGMPGGCRLQPGLVLGPPRVHSDPGAETALRGTNSEVGPRGRGTGMRGRESHHSPLPLVQAASAGAGGAGQTPRVAVRGRPRARPLRAVMQQAPLSSSGGLRGSPSTFGAVLPTPRR